MHNKVLMKVGGFPRDHRCILNMESGEKKKKKKRHFMRLFTESGVFFSFYFEFCMDPFW